MITVSLKAGARTRKSWLRRRQTVLAVFSYRYDAHLVPDLIANVDPVVDGWIAFDDRGSTDLFSNEPARRRSLLQAAWEAGADWILAIDPDERLEAETARIAGLTAKRGRVAWGFNLRELHSRDAYRVDGIWAKKRRFRLFRSFDPAGNAGAGLHDRWYPRDAGFREIHPDLNLYHLKMIEPRRRSARRDLYNFLDPDLRHQPIGYDYLADATGARFETIPAGRHFLPPHADDGGLWMPDVAATSA